MKRIIDFIITILLPKSSEAFAVAVRHDDKVLLVLDGSVFLLARATALRLAQMIHDEVIESADALKLRKVS